MGVRMSKRIKSVLVRKRETPRCTTKCRRRRLRHVKKRPGALKYLAHPFQPTKPHLTRPSSLPSRSPFRENVHATLLHASQHPSTTTFHIFFTFSLPRCLPRPLAPTLAAASRICTASDKSHRLPKHAVQRTSCLSLQRFLVVRYSVYAPCVLPHHKASKQASSQQAFHWTFWCGGPLDSKHICRASSGPRTWPTSLVP